eukprot:768231-Hanusia_phi.AAC.5
MPSFVSVEVAKAGRGTNALKARLDSIDDGDNEVRWRMGEEEGAERWKEGTREREEGGGRGWCMEVRREEVGGKGDGGGKAREQEQQHEKEL